MPRQKLKQRADGRYRCKYNGIYFYGSTQQEALEARDEYKRQEAQGIRQESIGATVSAYAARWVVAYKSGLSDKHYNTQIRILNKFCEYNENGSKRVADITPTDIMEFYNSERYIVKKGEKQLRSQSSLNDTRDTLRGLFRAAVADRIITFDPTASTTVPKGEKGTHRALTEHEKGLILSVPHRMQSVAVLMLYEGLRRGEALAIDVDRDIDFEAKCVNVSRAIRFIGEHLPKEVDPKTHAGIRSVPFFGDTERFLQGKHGILCPSAKGKTMTESAWKRAWQSYMNALCTYENGISRRWYGKTKAQKKLAKEGKLPPWKEVSFRAHDLRHTCCTMFRDAGVDIKQAIIWMGHADITMILKIYDHPDAIRAKTSIEKVQKFLSGGQNGGQDENAHAETQVTTTV